MICHMYLFVYLSEAHGKPADITITQTPQLGLTIVGVKSIDPFSPSAEELK